MYPTLRLLQQRIPLIRFLGKRVWPAVPEPPHVHPAAPVGYQKVFTHEEWKASLSPSKKVYNEFWEAPERFWNSKNHDLAEEEIEAIMSGGASLK